MSSDARLVLQCLFQTIWQLFTTWCIPGTNVTPGAFLVFLVFACLVFRFIQSLFGVGGGSFGSGARSAKSIGGSLFGSASSGRSGSGGSGGRGK